MLHRPRAGRQVCRARRLPGSPRGGGWVEQEVAILTSRGVFPPWSMDPRSWNHSPAYRTSTTPPSDRGGKGRQAVPSRRRVSSMGSSWTALMLSTALRHRGEGGLSAWCALRSKMRPSQPHLALSSSGPPPFLYPDLRREACIDRPATRAGFQSVDMQGFCLLTDQNPEIRAPEGWSKPPQKGSQIYLSAVHARAVHTRGRCWRGSGSAAP